MEDMKGDMSGGGAVIEATGALADLGIPLRTVAVVAATENMPAGGAFRPGDILRARNGKTIEVINTDAEGRLVLADALTYAREQGRRTSWTGHAHRRHGARPGRLLRGRVRERRRLASDRPRCGEASGDHAWPFPLHPRYRRYVDRTSRT